MKKLFTVLFVAGFSSLAAQNFDRVFVFLNKNPNKVELPKDSVDALMEKHFENMALLGQEGKLINAGPFEGGGGIFVLNTSSIDSVQNWIEQDPAVKANRWIIEMYPFTTTEGGSCVVDAEYEMVTYPFVRYTSSNEIANYKSGINAEKQVLTKELIAKLKEDGDLIMAGYFASNEGGVLVLKDESSIETIKSSNVVNSGTMSFKFKELWIAKGSFCEN